MEADPNEYLTAKDVMRILKVSQNKAYVTIKRIPFHIREGRTLRVQRWAFDKYMESKQWRPSEKKENTGKPTATPPKANGGSNRRKSRSRKPAEQPKPSPESSSEPDFLNVKELLKNY